MNFKRILAGVLSAVLITTPIFEKSPVITNEVYAEPSQGELVETEYGDVTFSGNTTLNLAKGTKSNYGVITLSQDSSLTIKGAGYLTAVSITGEGDLTINSGNIELEGVSTRCIIVNDGNVHVFGDINLSKPSISLDPSGKFYASVQFNGGTNIIEGNIYAGDDSPITHFGGNVLLSEGTRVIGDIHAGDAAIYSFGYTGVHGNYISGNYSGLGGSIYIDGGVVEGNLYAGYSPYYNGGDIVLSNGIIKSSIIETGKTGGLKAPDHALGKDGVLKSTEDGTAWIITNSLPENMSKFVSGVTDVGGDITIYGNQTIDEDLYIDEWSSLNITSNSTLAVEDTGLEIDGTLINMGSVFLSEEAVLSGNGSVDEASTGSISQKKSFTADVISAKSGVYTGEDYYPYVKIFEPTKSDALGGIEIENVFDNPIDSYRITVSKDGKRVGQAINAGVYTVSVKDTVSGKTVKKDFEITPKSITKATVAYDATTYYYEGDAIVPKVTVTLGDLVLKSGQDYTISFENNDVAGNAGAVIVGCGNYAGQIDSSFRIVNTEYPISYELNGGKWNGKAGTSKYTVVSEFNFEKPVKKGYTFVGWYKEAEFTNKISGIKKGSKGALDLFAKWKLDKYSITYVLDGGTNAANNPTGYNVNTAVSFENPTKEGYDFIGWYLDADFTEDCDSLSKGSTGNVTLYAKFVPHVHVLESIPAVEATCTSTGLTEGKKCTVCGEIVVPQKTVKRIPHTAVTIPAVEPTCTQKGLTEGQKCEVCGKILVSQKKVDKIPHTSVVDPAVEPTLTTTGLTEGSHCSVCNTVLVAQKVVPKLDPRTYNPFTDVPAKKYYTSNVIYINYRGVMTGFSSTVFGVGSNLKREDMVTLLWKNEGKPSQNVQSKPFPDIGLGKYYTDAVAWAKKNSIVNGYSSGDKAGNFGYGDNISRQDFIKIIYGYAIYKGYDTSVKSPNTYLKCEDASKVAGYARESMNWGYENGFIGNGSPLRPREEITREDVATIIKRFLEKYDPIGDRLIGEGEEYTITYILNGGTNNSKNITKYVANGVSAPLYEPARANCTFDGWYTDASFTKKITCISNSISKNLTIYAKWIPGKYTVSFNGNGSNSGSMSNMTLELDKNYNLTKNAFMRNGFAFTGWNTAANGSGTRYADTASVRNLTTSTNITLYAQWKLIGTAFSSVEATGNTSIKLNWNKQAYVLGYSIRYSKNSDMSDCKYVTIENKDTVSREITGLEKNVMYYAQIRTYVKVNGSTINSDWSATRTISTLNIPGKYTINFNGNGATGGTMSAMTCEVNKNYNLATNAYVRNGFSFIGWSTKADGSGVFYSNNASIINLVSEGANITLYAQWKLNGILISSVNATGNTSIRVNWNKQSHVNGYQIRYSKNDSMSDAKLVTIENKDTSLRDITGLERNRSYYIQLRTYYNNNGITIYSDWCTTKSVTTLNAITETGTLSDPYRGCDTITKNLQRYRSNPIINYSIRVEEYYYGEKANTMANTTNPCNDVPASDEQWIFIKYYIKNNSSTETLKATDILGLPFKPYYTSSGASCNIIDKATLTNRCFGITLNGYGIYDVVLAPGASGYVWQGILLPKSNGIPYLQINTGYDSINGRQMYAYIDISKAKKVNGVDADQPSDNETSEQTGENDLITSITDVKQYIQSKGKNNEIGQKYISVSQDLINGYKGSSAITIIEDEVLLFESALVYAPDNFTSNLKYIYNINNDTICNALDGATMTFQAMGTKFSTDIVGFGKEFISKYSGGEKLKTRVSSNDYLYNLFDDYHKQYYGDSYTNNYFKISILNLVLLCKLNGISISAIGFDSYKVG